MGNACEILKCSLYKKKHKEIPEFIAKYVDTASHQYYIMLNICYWVCNQKCLQQQRATSEFAIT